MESLVASCYKVDSLEGCRETGTLSGLIITCSTCDPDGVSWAPRVKFRMNSRPPRICEGRAKLALPSLEIQLHNWHHHDQDGEEDPCNAASCSLTY